MVASNKENTCCFTGHRAFSKKMIERIVKRLDKEIDLLIQQGVINYISGGAIGFDQIAASLVLGKKRQEVDIRLIFALPCHNQDEKWNDRQKQLYRSLLNEADEIHYVSEVFTDECMKERNYFMVDNSAYCICALTNPISGTGQTTRYAQQQGLQIINVAK